MARLILALLLAQIAQERKDTDAALNSARNGGKLLRRLAVHSERLHHPNPRIFPSGRFEVESIVLLLPFEMTSRTV